MIGRSFLRELYDDYKPVALLVARSVPPGTPRVSVDTGEIGWNRRDEFSRYLVWVKCPTCGAGVLPLAAPLTTRYIESGTGWLDLDSRTWWSDYLCRCRHGHPFVMHSWSSD